MKAFDCHFEAGGKQYVLRYSFAARRAFEHKTKQSVPGLLKRLSDTSTQTADEIIDLFMLLLGSEQPDIAADEVEKIVDDLGGEDEAVALLTRVLSEQTPAEDGKAHPYLADSEDVEAFTTWVELGLDPDAFWTKTPLEVSIIIEARWAGELRRQNQVAWLAWHIAALSRAKKLPSLDRLLMKKRKAGHKRRQAWQEQMAIMDKWAEATKPKA